MNYELRNTISNVGWVEERNPTFTAYVTSFVGFCASQTGTQYPFCPISASGENFNPQNTSSIPAVKISLFLELEQK